MEMGQYTKKQEYYRSIDHFENTYKEQGLYYALYLLVDSGYTGQDLRAMADLIKPRKVNQ